MTAWLLLVAPPLVPLVITAINLATWRPATTRAPPLRASALVPARNEEGGIAACVEALLRQPFTEIIVCDDRSTDTTPEILAGLAAREPRLRVLQGVPLPAGRVGKAHACHQLASAASGDLLVFVDADTILQPHALERVSAAVADADVVSFLPLQQTGSAGEGLVVPLLHLTYTSWLPLRLVRALSDPRILAANGQIVAVRREAYARFGGYGSVASEVVDDMAFCRAAKRAGLRVAFVDGACIATCRMYRSGREAWEGFSKNLYEGIGASAGALALTLALYATCFLLPWFALPFAPIPAAVGVLANLTQRVLLAVRFRHAAWVVPAHPVGVLALLALAVNSWRWSRSGTIRWRGRIYAARGARGGA
jgi:chlorobactene glucosyltransferase